MAAFYTMEIDQGADASFCFCFEDEIGALSFPDHTAAMQIRRSTFSNDVIDTLTTDNGRLVMDCEGGKITVLFPCAITEKYPSGVAHFDIEVESPSGTITRLLDGKIEINAEVTHARCSK